MTDGDPFIFSHCLLNTNVCVSYLMHLCNPLSLSLSVCVSLSLSAGYRLIKVVLYLIGFLVSFAVIYFGIILLTQEQSENWIPYVALGCALVVGLIVGLITVCIHYIGIFFLGGSLGFLIVWFILGFIDVTFFQNHIYVPIAIAVVSGILVGIIALLLQKWLFLIGSSVLGGFILVWGLDYYLELGFMIYYLLLFAEKRSELKPCWYSWLIIPVFIILFISGFLVQVLVTGRKYDHKKEMRGLIYLCIVTGYEKNRSVVWRKKVDFHLIILFDIYLLNA